MRYILLINRKFPYEKGETFLENELVSYKDKMDKIIILPSNINKKYKRTRDIPANAITILYQKGSIHYRNFKYGLKGIKSMFSSKTSNSLNINGVKRSLLNKWYYGYFVNAAKEQFREMYNRLTEYSFGPSDEIIVYSYWFYINAKAAILLAKELEKSDSKVTVITRAHRFDIYEEISRFHFIPERLEMIKELDGIYGCSDNGVKYLMHKYNNYESKIITSRLGTMDYGLGHYKYNADVFHIVSCSRLVSIKRIDKIIDALKIVGITKQKIVWTHLGGGKIKDHLEERCKDEIPFIKVEFLGTLENKEIYKYYQTNQVDLFINVSESEGLPVSIMEAISFGIPVLATNVGGTNEIVYDGMNGFLLEKDFKLIELSNIIKSVMNLPMVDYLYMRSNSRSIWENNYKAENNYSDFLNDIVTIK
jgi:glycosyltransferase involved in cell wall biosynthesis